MFEGYSAETCAVKIPASADVIGSPPSLGEIFECDSAYLCTGEFLLLSIGGRGSDAQGTMRGNLKARTPIGDSRNLQTFLHTNLHIDLHTFLHTCLHTNLHTFGDTCLHTFLHTYLHL